LDPAQVRWAAVMCRADTPNIHIRRFTMFDLIIVFLFVIADFTEFKDKYLIIEKFVPVTP
jgi:hypothetical protein